MPTLVIENVPAPLFDEIRRLAEKKKCTTSEAAIVALERVLKLSEPPLPDAPCMTSEIPAPFDLPRPEGTIVDPSRIIHLTDYVPRPHDVDLPGEE